MFAELLTPENITALVTLSAMEIILGIDNIVFIAIVVDKLPKDKQPKIRSLGIFLALFSRLALLFSISWIMGLQEPLFAIFEHTVSGRDLILLLGGLFLIAKSTHEIHTKVEGAAESELAAQAKANSISIPLVILQIVILDLIFSLDSVITAVGMAKSIAVMCLAMIIAVGVMLVSAASISNFVERHPTVKILALSFLILIGVMLVFEGMGGHMSKGYIYFAMFFSLVVELLNMRYRSKRSAAQ